MHARTRTREAGYTLVMLVMTVAIMGIMMGAAVQLASFQMQREKEAELIFRGEQYVEAIRLYKARYGRNPMRMKEIWEADPKVVRKKWKDPITDSENWGIIFVGQERQVGGAQQQDLGLGESGQPVPTGTAGFGQSGTFGGRNRNQNNGLPNGVQRGDDGELIGPIAGVHSTSCDESIKVYEGRQTYCEWRFYLKEQRQGGGARGGARGAGQGGGRGGIKGPRGGYHAGEDPREFLDGESATPGPYPTGTPRP